MNPILLVHFSKAMSFTCTSQYIMRSNSKYNMFKSHWRLYQTFSKVYIQNFRYLKVNSSQINESKLRISTNSKDANNGEKSSWINSKFIPQVFKPYLHLARADKQVGSLLLFYPCCWSVALAAPLGAFPDILLILKFGLGAVIMRSAGCTINDLLDKDFDKHVERTKSRPLASGELTTQQGLLFLTIQLLCGLAILSTFNANSIAMGLLSMPLVIIYPLMKRYTNWPQLVLGLAFNWGALMGWVAVNDSISLIHVAPLYASGIFWTLVYDTIYGYQDRKDDKMLGLKSTSLYFGDNPQWSLTALASISVLSILTTGYISNLTLPFYIGISGISCHLIWQIWTLNVNDPINLWYRFNSNKYVGAGISLAIIFGHF